MLCLAGMKKRRRFPVLRDTFVVHIQKCNIIIIDVLWISDEPVANFHVCLTCLFTVNKRICGRRYTVHRMINRGMSYCKRRYWERFDRDSVALRIDTTRTHMHQYGNDTIENEEVPNDNTLTLSFVVWARHVKWRSVLNVFHRCKIKKGLFVSERSMCPK